MLNAVMCGGVRCLYIIVLWVARCCRRGAMDVGGGEGGDIIDTLKFGILNFCCSSFVVPFQLHCKGKVGHISVCLKLYYEVLLLTVNTCKNVD